VKRATSLVFIAAILAVSAIMAGLYLQPALAPDAALRTLIAFGLWTGLALVSGTVLAVRLWRRRG